MKNIKFIPAVLILFAAFTLTSCSGDVEPIDPSIVLNPDPIPDPDPDPDPIPADGAFKVDFDGQTYVATMVQASILDSQLAINGFRGTVPNMQTVGLSVGLNGTGVGSYPANENLLVYQLGGTSLTQYVSFNPDDDAANTGSVVISSIDAANHKISGTFQFTGFYEDNAGNVTTKTFTNGVFTNIPYTQIDSRRKN